MLGLYIHIPFCIKKCAYCDFVSTGDISMIPAYIKALNMEMRLTGAMYRQVVDSVYIGGGTPGVLDEGLIGGIVEQLKTRFEFADDAEITIETNPCTVSGVKLEEYLRAGINRISIGMQAAQDGLLAFLGRQHDAARFDEAYDAARQAGFANINADAIYAIPGQSMDDWRDTLNHLLYKKPEHISAYALKIEQETPLGEKLACGEVEAVDEDSDADMYAAARELLTSKGYINYEISNFARWGYACRHNLKYWRLENYLGLGVASHSNIERLRFAHADDISAYIKLMEQGELRYASSQFVDDKERKLEYLMLKLRLAEGFDATEYREMFGEDFFKSRKGEVEKAVADGLIEVEDERIKPTAKGFFLQNSLVLTLAGNI